MADKGALRSYFEGEQADFVELAGSLTAEQWAAPSLCEGWTVRDAVVHTAWHIHLPTVPAVEFLRYKRLGQKEFYRRLFEQYRSRSPESVVEWLGSPATVSGPNYCEVVLHQQDVRRPLGMPRHIPDDRFSWMLNFCLTRSGNSNAGGKPRDWSKGLRLVATDLDWTAGDGPEIRGPGEAILMAITGRDGTIEQLSGPGVDVLAGRAVPAYWRVAHPAGNRRHCSRWVADPLPSIPRVQRCRRRLVKCPTVPMA